MESVTESLCVCKIAVEHTRMRIKNALLLLFYFKKEINIRSVFPIEIPTLSLIILDRIYKHV